MPTDDSETSVERDRVAEMYPDTDPDEIINYMIRVPDEEWRTWTETVPRSTPLYERLRELIRADASSRSAFEDMDERMARLLATRVKHRGSTALQALDRGDEAAAREEIAEMREIAKQFED